MKYHCIILYEISLLFYWEIRSACHSVCNLRYAIPRESLVVIQKRSNYSDHLVVKQLTNEYEFSELACL